jgi:hypothetical protein
MDCVRGYVNMLDWNLAELDAPMQLVLPRADDLVGMAQPEWDEEQSWLVDVVIVLVHDHDLDAIFVEEMPHAIGAECAPGSSAQDHDPFGHDPIVGHTS